MSQQNHLVDLLDRINGWDVDKCRQNMDSVLPEMLIKFKESTYIEEGIGLLRVICTSFVPVVSIEDVDDKIFSQISDPTSSLVKDVLNKIHLNVEGSLRDTVEELKDVIVECLQWLVCICECVEACVHHMQQVASIVSLPSIRSLPACAISILTQTYLHCKESSSLYGNLLDGLGDPLSALFKKAHSLQLTLVSLLDKTSVPNSGLEEHVTTLCSVCNGLFEMCKVVTSLDVKLVVGLWKSISRLCSQNQSLLRDRLDVSPLICYLCDELTSGYSYLFQLCPTANGESLSQGDSRAFTKCLKIQGFQMKVLVALLRDFIDYLGPCEHRVLKLLLYILRCLPPSLSALPVSGSQESEIRGQVANAVVPVLQHLVTNRAFRTHLTSSTGDLEQEDHLPLLLLQLNVLDLLPKCDVDVVDCWLSQADHDRDTPSKGLLTSIFQSTEKCFVEMRVPVMLPGPMVDGKPQSQVSLYHHLAVHLCGFIGACSTRHFPSLESFLLETVFGTDEMCSLLATDCWCFLARYGSASLCFAHVKVLLDVLQACHGWRDCVKGQKRLNVAQSRLLYLLRRLIKFLSPEHQASVVDLNNPEHNLDLWLTLTLAPFCEKVQTRVGKAFASWAVKVLDAEAGKADQVLQALDCLDQLFSHPSLVSSCLDHSQQAVVFETVTQLWTNHLSAPGDFEPMGDVLLTKLLPVTKYFLSAMETSSILKVVQVLYNSLKTSDSKRLSLCLACAQFMESLGICQMQPSLERDELLSTIPKLFYRLMTDSNPLVQTQSLAAFGKFASHTPHEECIPLCLQSDSGLKARVDNYLNQVPYRNDEEPFVTVDYLKQLQEQRRQQQQQQEQKRQQQPHCESSNTIEGVGVVEPELHTGEGVQHYNDDDKEDDDAIHNQRAAAAPAADDDDDDVDDTQDSKKPPAKRAKLEFQRFSPPQPSNDCSPPPPPSFQNILERLKVAADDLESVCCSLTAANTAPPKEFVEPARLVLSRIHDCINDQPSSWFDSLS